MQRNNLMGRRDSYTCPLVVVFAIAICHAAFATEPVSTPRADKPNFVIIFADDLGYGDLSCYGHPTIRTPHLDRMAAEGMRFTQFYSASSVCTPSRAALMTGRLPIRTGMCSDKRRVLFPNSGGGIQDSELTLAEALKEQGYATACIGKWHLGFQPQFLPTSHGFDTYYGIPYSNDMDAVGSAPKGRAKFQDPKIEYFNVPLLRDTEQIERPADQTTITRRYTEQAIAFIKRHKDDPFFVYLPHSLPHVPLFRGKEFEGTSRRGLYGDVIEEIDWSVGQILDTIRSLQLTDNTVVVFTSDNGPWLIFNEQGGSAGLLRDGKGCTYEGGMREPMIAWGPGIIPAGVVNHDLASTLDLMPTFVSMAGGKLPQDRTYDGYDLSHVLDDNLASPRNEMFFYRGTRLMAVRKGPWKAHFITQSAYGGGRPETHDPPVLYNLDVDPSEKVDVGKDHPDAIAEILKLAENHKAGVQAPPSQLEIPLN